MKILQVLVGLDWGGAEKLVLETAPRLINKGFEVEVVSLRGAGPIGRELRAKNIKLTVLSTRLWNPLSIFKAVKFFRNNSFDIVHSHLFWGNIVSACLNKRARLIWHIHETGEWMGKVEMFLERWLSKRANKVICVSQAVSKAFRERVPSFPEDRIETVLSGIEISKEISRKNERRLDFGFKKGDFVVGYLGRFDLKIKGLDTLIKAAKILERERIRFVLVGNGKDERIIKQMIKDYEIGEKFLIINPTEPKELYYQTFDIFVLPSRFEGLGLVLLEAMSAGLPVVATRVGGIQEVVVDGKTGVLIRPGLPDKLADTIWMLMVSPSARRAWGRAGRERVIERFGINRYVDALEKIYVQKGV